MASRLFIMPQSDRSTAEVWFEILYSSRNAPRHPILGWLRIHWKSAAVAIAFWTIYGLGSAFWLAR